MSAPPPPLLQRAATYVPPQVLDELNKMDNSPTNSSSSSSSSSTTTSSSSSSSSSSTSTFPPTEVYGGARKGAKQYQEDSLMHYMSTSRRVTIGAVFDGHGGYNGMMASNTARDFATQIFKTADVKGELDRWTEAEWRAQLLMLFEQMHETIRQKFLNHTGDDDDDHSSSSSSSSSSEKRYLDETKIVRSSATSDPIHGGTTCTVVVQIRALTKPTHVTLITANVGDSTALIMPSRSACSFLSVDHGPENSDEFARIEALPASQYPLKLLLVYDKTSVYRKYECPCVFRSDGVRDPIYVNNPWANGLHPTNVRYEPAVYAVTPRAVSRDSTCIAMTRALGDFYAHQFGLTAIPDINVRHVDLEQAAKENEHYSIVLASDGVWDCWRYDDFASFCNAQLHEKKQNLQTMGNTTLDESISRAVQNFGAKHYDDACAVIWRIN